MVHTNKQLSQTLKEIIERKGYVEIPASGSSMFPLIRKGNICRFRPFRPAEAEKGDILLFVTAMGQLVGHRLIDIKEHRRSLYYTCKGDSNLSPDQPVTAEQIIGTMASIHKRSYSIRCDGRLARIWAWVVMRIPFVSRFIHGAIGLRNGTRERRQKHEGSNGKKG